MVVAAMQAPDQHIRGSLGFRILPKDTSTCGPGESNQRPSNNKTALFLSHSHPTSFQDVKKKSRPADYTVSKTYVTYRIYAQIVLCMHAWLCALIAINVGKTTVTFCYGSVSKDDVLADLALVTKKLETVPGSSAFAAINTAGKHHVSPSRQKYLVSLLQRQTAWGEKKNKTKNSCSVLTNVETLSGTVVSDTEAVSPSFNTTVIPSSPSLEKRTIIWRVLKKFWCNTCDTNLNVSGLHNHKMPVINLAAGLGDTHGVKIYSHQCQT